MVAEGRPEILLARLHPGVKAVVDADLAPSVEPHGVGDPERPVMGVRLGLSGQHAFPARAVERPVVWKVESRRVLINDGLASVDDDGQPSRVVVPARLDTALVRPGLTRSSRGRANRPKA